MGRGTAARAYGGIVRPMLERASAIGGFDALFTERHGHAAERMRDVAACATSSLTAGTARALAGAGATIDDADGGVRTMDVSEYHGILAPRSGRPRWEWRGARSGRRSGGRR